MRGLVVGQTEATSNDVRWITGLMRSNFKVRYFLGFGNNGNLITELRPLAFSLGNFSYTIRGGEMRQGTVNTASTGCEFPTKMIWGK